MILFLLLLSLKVEMHLVLLVKMPMMFLYPINKCVFMNFVVDMKKLGMLIRNSLLRILILQINGKFLFPKAWRGSID